MRYGTFVELQIGAREIDVMSVHLNSGCFSKREDDDPEKQKDCRKLTRQIPILEAWIDNRARADKPFILLGDFNCRLAQDNDEIWKELDDN